MKPSMDLSALKRTRWYEYAIRFIFGGIITAVAGVIAARYGPYTGGFFLAFPAIFPASATLIEKHEKQKKEQKGLQGSTRGILSAGVEAAGAQMGSLGLIAFGATIFLLAPVVPSWQALGAALGGWAVCS